MDIIKHSFPILSPARILYNDLKTDYKLLNEAKLRGYFESDNEYSKLAKEWILGYWNLMHEFSRIDEVKKLMWDYCQAIAASVEIKLNEKEAICALLLSEIMPEFCKKSAN